MPIDDWPDQSLHVWAQVEAAIVNEYPKQAADSGYVTHPNQDGWLTTVRALRLESMGVPVSQYFTFYSQASKE